MPRSPRRNGAARTRRARTASPRSRRRAASAVRSFERLETRDLLAISFAPAGSIGGLFAPTSLQFGPDDRLYVAQQNGVINAYTVALQNDEYVATAQETLTLPSGAGVVQSLQNHDDDGSPAGNTNRQVTGIVVTGTATNPVLYVSSSDPRISENGEVGLDTNSGVVTRVTWTGSEWETLDLIRGLPRSEENHAVNGMALTPDGETLYLQVGGNTNDGAPSAFFSYTAEYALAAALLEIDLVDLDSRPVLTDPDGGQGGVARDYVYDLPTLDDPSVPNDGVREDANGLDVDGPWGGNDGFNQAILPSDAPLSIYADGLRNAYDVVLTTSGLLFTVDNGSNPNLGDVPLTDGAGDATNLPNNGGDGDPEPLFRIDPLGYYGHPNPVRSNQDLAWTVFDDTGAPDAAVSPNAVPDVSALVPASLGIPAGFVIDPSKFTADAARLAESGVKVDRNDPLSNSLTTLGSSTNGIVEYTADAFDGALQGALLVTQFNDNVTVLNVNADGTALDPLIDPGPDMTLGTADDFVADADGSFQLPGLAGLANPLDVTVGPDGTIWVAEIGAGEVSVFAPSDVVPPDDLDFDDDGLLNPVDPFLRDATNGGSVVVAPGDTVTWTFAASGTGGSTPGPGGYGGGLTGVMIDGVTDFEAFFQEPSTLPDQDVNLDNVKFTTAAGGGATVVEVVSNGDPFQTKNSGEFLFHTGATIADTVDAFTVKWTVFNPGDGFSGNFQQIGGYLGTGDQSNYLKLVALQSPNGEIQMTLEDADSATSTLLQADDLFNVTEAEAKKIIFELEVDVVAETATPTVNYETSAGAVETVVGGPMSLSGSAVLDAIKGDYSVAGQTTGLAVGLFSTNTGQPPANAFQAVFDDIEIVAAAPPPAEPVHYRVNAGGPLVAATDGGPDWGEDTLPANSPFLSNPGGNKVNAFPVTPGATVPSTTPAEVFLTERWDNPPGADMSYAFPVAAGEQYEVRLYAGNGFDGTAEPGTRVFDVAIEGVVLPNLDDLDLSNQFGHLTGGVISQVVTAADGSLDIEFLHNSVENPLVNAIEVIQLDSATTVSIASPTPATNVESGDTGATSLTFPVTFSQTPAEPVTVEYAVSVDGVESAGLTLALGTADGAITVDVPNDDANNGRETVVVTLTGVTAGGASASLGATIANATVNEDDLPPTPTDRFNGAVVLGDGLSSDPLNPTDAVLSLGANTLVSQQDPTDLDYLTFEVPADQQLTAINLIAYDGDATPTLLGLHAGETFPDESTLLGAGADLSALLDGATLFDATQVGTDLLDDLASTTIEGDGRTVAGLTTPLGPGLYTLWLKQDAATTASTLELVTQATGGGPTGGAAELAIIADTDDVQASATAADAFVITNTGGKDIEAIVLDISSALLADAVFDPFGDAGDSIGKLLTIDTDDGTGVVAPDHGTSVAPGTAYLGAGGVNGFEGVRLFFDAGASGGFNPGETVGFSIDGDPNSVAGTDKLTLDSGAVPDWDVGGVSGAELIGATFTVTFTDGTTATGSLQGVGNQGGSRGTASQDAPDVTATLSVNGVTAGGVGQYTAGGPTVVVSGPAGYTARVVLAKGILQPETNNFSEPFASQLDAQLATLAASDFPANNVAELQTVDVLLNGADQDLTALFDFNEVLLFNLPNAEDELPLAFTAGIIDPVGGATLGAVSDPIYLTETEIVEADLELSLIASDPSPAVGATIDLTLTVTNFGPDDTTGVEVLAPIPAGLTFDSAIGDGLFDEVSGVWNVGELAASGAAALTITVSVDPATPPTPVGFTFDAQVQASGAIDPDSTPGDGFLLGDDDDASVLITPDAALKVTAFTPTTSGFEVAFNKPLDTGSLNLYAGAGSSASADLAVTVDGTPVAGSAVYDAATNTLRFVKTGGPLAEGAYAVTLTSGVDAFVAADGFVLDGGAPGGDYTDAFTVAANGAATLSIADFARGPGQDVDVSPINANDTRLPIVVDSVSGLQTLELDVLYDPALLQISAVTSPIAGLIVNATIDNTLGKVNVTAISPSPFAGTDVTLLDLAATVPSGAAYGGGQVIELAQPTGSLGILNEGAIAVVTDAAVHKAAFLGDADGSQSYNPNDTGLLPTVSAGAATGFAAYPLTDPVLVADVTGNGALSTLDSSVLAQEVLGVDTPQLPPLPVGSGSAIPATVDPTFGVPAAVFAKAGDALSVPVTLDIEPGAAIYAAGFEATTTAGPATLTGVSAGDDWPTSDWARAINEPAPGTVRFNAFNTLGQPSADGVQSVATLDYTVAPTANPGDAATLQVAPLDLNDGGLAWNGGDGELVVTYDTDHDRNGTVGAEDYDIWAADYGSTTQLAGDANGDGVVNILDYVLWRDQEGLSVATTGAPEAPPTPEPTPPAVAFAIWPTTPSVDPAELVVIGPESAPATTDNGAALLLLLEDAPQEDDANDAALAEDASPAADEADAEREDLEEAFAAL